MDVDDIKIDMLVDEDEKTPKEVDAEIKRRKERQVGFKFVSKFKLEVWSRKIVELVISPRSFYFS